MGNYGWPVPCRPSRKEGQSPHAESRRGPCLPQTRALLNTPGSPAADRGVLLRERTSGPQPCRCLQREGDSQEAAHPRSQHSGTAPPQGQGSTKGGRGPQGQGVHRARGPQGQGPTGTGSTGPGVPRDRVHRDRGPQGGRGHKGGMGIHKWGWGSMGAGSPQEGPGVPRGPREPTRGARSPRDPGSLQEGQGVPQETGLGRGARESTGGGQEHKRGQGVHGGQREPTRGMGSTRGSGVHTRLCSHAHTGQPQNPTELWWVLPPSSQPGALKQALGLVSLAATPGWRAGRGAQAVEWRGRRELGRAWGGRMRQPVLWKAEPRCHVRSRLGRWRLECGGVTRHLEGGSQ